MDKISELRSFKPQHNFFIGVDSDGCAFDAMGIKHKLAFIPMAVTIWGLEKIETEVYEVGEFINLYSNKRGINRFPGLLLIFEYLQERADIEPFVDLLPNFEELREFVNSGMPMSNDSLRKFAEGKDSKFLRELMEWSTCGDQLFTQHVENLPPFDYVAKSLLKASTLADTMIVSAASTEGLYNDWTKGGIMQYMTLVAGQEVGSKKQQLALAAGNKYKANSVLMVGDAPGDMQAAKENGALFYPINPGYEVQSWKRFHNEALERFIQGTYAGEYEEHLIKEFMQLLPEEKPWEITHK
jgi:phosphoglycolate phosphatase-like HAD superfamily hydrolase